MRSSCKQGGVRQESKPVCSISCDKVCRGSVHTRRLFLPAARRMRLWLSGDWLRRHVRHDVRAAGRRCGGDIRNDLSRAVLHGVQGLTHVQHVELLLLQQGLRELHKGHLPAQEPDQPFLPEVRRSPLSLAMVYVPTPTCSQRHLPA